MILTVTPNAAIDRTYCVEGFHVDSMYRPSFTRAVAGGKGVNVARVYQTLGGKAYATGFLGGIHGQFIARGLAREGIAAHFVRVRGESRLCIIIADPRRGTQTELYESGPTLTARASERLLRRVERLLAEHGFDALMLSGSLPPGTPDTLFADLIAVGRRCGVPAALDSSGAPLQLGLAARPWMAKLNRAEMESMTGRDLPGRAETGEAARVLRAENGVSVVIATRGAEGALRVSDVGAWCAVPPPISHVNAVASGDAFAGAFLWAWTCGESPGAFEPALRLATGAGAANAAVAGAVACTREAILDLAARVEVRRLA